VKDIVDLVPSVFVLLRRGGKHMHVENVLSKSPDFVINAIGATEQEISLENPSSGCEVDLFEAKEVLAKKEFVSKCKFQLKRRYAGSVSQQWCQSICFRRWDCRLGRRPCQLSCYFCLRKLICLATDNQVDYQDNLGRWIVWTEREFKLDVVPP
jgi:hypothetical protein